jgi:predicted amidohydrolase
MQEILNLSLVQSNIFWADVDKNLKHFSSLISKIKQTNIILLPEMFNTSFCPERNDLAEKMNGKTISWMKDISKIYDCVVTGTLMIKENNKVYNRLVWISPNKEIITYDKSHLFSIIKENKYISKGNKRLIVSEYGWKFCPLICYDLRFPVFSRNTEDYDVLIYLANWPKARIDAWDTLLKARSIENQCYTVGLNRIGQDGNGIEFNGHSKVFDAFGKEIFAATDNNEDILQVVISKKSLLQKRNKMNFLNDQDSFTLL